MKKILLSAALFLLTHALVCGQSPSPNLSADRAQEVADEHYRHAINDYAETIEADWQSGILKSDGYQMPFEYFVNGDMPDNGYPLYISLHGGGSTQPEVNDKQWENQKRLYGVVDGVYFVPRSPTDTWNMWHRGYMDDLLLQVVTYSVARLNVDASRVYILGYSAGGDGVYNLAPRLSDRFAAAAMMAGHPGDAQIENLRNLPFAIYMGAEDKSYNRAGLAAKWLSSFEQLKSDDPQGYEYSVNIYEGKGHWMDRADAVAIGWLANHKRASSPHRVIWIQDDVLHTRKYNLEVSDPKRGFRIEERVNHENNTIYIHTEHYAEVTIWLDDSIIDLERPVAVIFNDQEVFRGVIPREERNIVTSLRGRYDPEYVFCGRVTVAAP